MGDRNLPSGRFSQFRRPFSGARPCGESQPRSSASLHSGLYSDAPLGLDLIRTANPGPASLHSGLNSGVPSGLCEPVLTDFAALGLAQGLQPFRNGLEGFILLRGKLHPATWQDSGNGGKEEIRRTGLDPKPLQQARMPASGDAGMSFVTLQPGGCPLARRQ